MINFCLFLIKVLSIIIIGFCIGNSFHNWYFYLPFSLWIGFVFSIGFDFLTKYYTHIVNAIKQENTKEDNNSLD